MLGRSVLLRLEVLVAADIVRTVTGRDHHSVAPDLVGRYLSHVGNASRPSPDLAFSRDRNEGGTTMNDAGGATHLGSWSTTERQTT